MTKEELRNKLKDCDLTSIKNINSYVLNVALREGLYLNDEEVKDIVKFLSNKNTYFVERVVNYLINVIKINKWEDWELTAQDYGHRLFERYIKSVVDEFKVKYKVEVTPEMMVEIESKVIPQWR